MLDQPKPSTGFTAIGIFLFFGALMASLAGTSLVWRGTFLDPMWTLNPSAYQHLAPLGKTVGIPFLLLGAILALAGVLWFRRNLWGWRLAVAVMATQLLGDLLSALRGDLVRGLVGFAIASLLLFYLLRPNVRAAFDRVSSGVVH
jgi:hypothetical protein